MTGSSNVTSFGRVISVRGSIARLGLLATGKTSPSDVRATVDLLGEILGGPERPKFQRGVTNYPTIGDNVDMITHQDLRTVYAPVGSDQIDVGTLQQDASVIAYV